MSRIHHPQTWRLELSFGALAGKQSRADVMVSAARNLAARGGHNIHEGRGPIVFDPIGFVRACVQASADFNPDFRRWSPTSVPVADLAGYRETGATLDEARDLVTAWGLTHHHWNDAQAGDVLLHMGRGPVMTVLITPRRRAPFTPQVVAGAWDRARLYDGIGLNHHTVGAFRWPTATGGSGPGPRLEAAGALA